MSKLEELKIKCGINDNPDQEGLDLFAAMIINECMDAARKYTLESSGSTSFGGTVYVCEAIKEHFDNIKEKS
jgi:hypothetical protein